MSDSPRLTIGNLQLRVFRLLAVVDYHKTWKCFQNALQKALFLLILKCFVYNTQYPEILHFLILILCLLWNNVWYYSVMRINLQFGRFGKCCKSRSAKYTWWRWWSVRSKCFFTGTAVRTTWLLLLLFINFVTNWAVTFLDFVSVMAAFIFAHEICLLRNQSGNPSWGSVVRRVVIHLTIFLEMSKMFTTQSFQHT